MKNLNQYENAKRVAKLVEKGETFVRVISGPLEGTIAQVLEVKHRNYERHDFKLKCEERKAFSLAGSFSELLTHFSGTTVYLEDENYSVSYLDYIGQEIAEGCVIVFPRASKTRSAIEMVTGTVRNVGRKGVFVQPFKIDNVEKHSDELIKVSKPDSAIRIGKHVPDAIMMVKLSAS